MHIISHHIWCCMYSVCNIIIVVFSFFRMLGGRKYYYCYCCCCCCVQTCMPDCFFSHISHCIIGIYPRVRYKGGSCTHPYIARHITTSPTDEFPNWFSRCNGESASAERVRLWRTLALEISRRHIWYLVEINVIYLDEIFPSRRDISKASHTSRRDHSKTTILRFVCIVCAMGYSPCFGDITVIPGCGYLAYKTWCASYVWYWYDTF